ncbi:MAG TPA: ATP-binding cassette domain-containing protein, partial [Candidatus Melainabacteria bacterium]|nr:ATP-binding cassette domain-containing protein [Candidatus Melainabacteria bacterium]
MIKITNLSKSFDGGKTYSVKALDLEVKKGELLVLLGSSGCGKSTTMKMINRLIEPTEGTIEIDGTVNTELDKVELRRNIGYVFQKIGLFPHMTIEENVCIVPKMLKWSKERMQERAKELLSLVELPLEQYGNRLPQELSGGQQQRVG